MSTLKIDTYNNRFWSNHFFLNCRPPFKKTKYWTTNTRMVKAWKDNTHVVACLQHSCIVEFSTRPRFDSDGEPPLSLIRTRIVDCMVWSTAVIWLQWVTTDACTDDNWSGDGQNETQDGSRIEEPIKKDLWNTDYFKVISTELLELLSVGRPT